MELNLSHKIFNVVDSQNDWQTTGTADYAKSERFHIRVSTNCTTDGQSYAVGELEYTEDQYSTSMNIYNLRADDRSKYLSYIDTLIGNIRDELVGSATSVAKDYAAAMAVATAVEASNEADQYVVSDLEDSAVADNAATSTASEAVASNAESVTE